MEEILVRSKFNPLITPQDLPYQANAVFNAGVADLVEEVLLLIRVESSSGRSHLIAARSKDGVGGWRFDDQALLHPAQGYELEANGVEDCRITWMDDLQAWGIAYVAYSPHGPCVALAKTTDFRTVERIGLALAPVDKNAALFPRKFDGLYAMLHRPSIGGGSIWISYSPDLRYWGGDKLLIPERGGPWWDGMRVGVCPPPIETEEGWLIIYHGVKEVAGGPVYRLGAALLDLNDPGHVIARARRWLLSPTEQYERTGDAPNVVFSCGSLIRDDELWLYYGAADCSLCLATARMPEIMEFVKTENEE